MITALELAKIDAERTLKKNPNIWNVELFRRLINLVNQLREEGGDDKFSGYLDHDAGHGEFWS